MKFRRKNRHPHTLVINGEQYSAVTGKTLGQRVDVPVAPQTKHIDGLHRAGGQRPVSLGAQSSPPTPRQMQQASSSPKPVAVRMLDGSPHVTPSTLGTAKRQPPGAQQLHQRSGELPPAPRIRSTTAAPPKVSVSAPLPTNIAPTITVSVPAVVHGASETKARAQRARRVARSSHIQKFVTASAAPALSTPPAARDQTTTAPVPSKNSRIENVHHQPPALSQYELNASPTDGKAKSNRSGNIIGHKARLASLSALGMSVLLIGGYIAYLNAPNLAVRIAASRSGVEATLPGYNPGGYRYAGPISYRPGSVVVRFRSDNGQSYTLAQEKSNWDSRSLLENVVARRDSDYRTFQEKGLTVYVYNDSNATWVNDGIHYSLEGTTSLPPEQILRIAASI